MKLKLHMLTIGALVMTACSSSGSLKTADAETITATVRRHLFGPDQIEISVNSMIYRGEWSLSPPSKDQTAGATFRHRRHMHSVKSTLRADDGSEMSCLWKTHLYAADGQCAVAGKVYSLSIK